MANPNYQAGGSFQTNAPARITSSDPWNFDQIPTAGTDTGQGAQTLLTNTSTSTLTNKTLTAPTITTPTMTMTSQDLIATGATGSAAANVSSAFPVLVNCNATGVSGAGINLPTGAPGNFAVIMNEMTGVLNIYAIASTINGTTGTTAATLSATGNRTVFASCTVAGAWNLRGNT